jgi:hypothetical protein
MLRILLPNEARLVDEAGQRDLTERYLLPALPDLEAFFLAVRAAVDAELEPVLRPLLSKRYPLGRCLEISQAAQQRLQQQAWHELTLSDSAQRGLQAYQAFRRAGGLLRQVWGDLRGEFFQNAFQLGSLYLDVSNDTVTRTKPKVEILPFADARFVPIRDFRHFARVAERYWKVRVYPNHLLPELAPYCPLIYVAQDGRTEIGEATGYMLSLSCAGQFALSEDLLGDPGMPPALFERARLALAGVAGKLPESAEQGREMALRACREYRRKRWHLEVQRTNRVMASVMAINHKLLPATRSQPITIHSKHSYFATKVEHMNLSETININGIDYPVAAMPEAALRELAMLQATDAKLAELQRDLAIHQTARNAYAAALKALLPSA